jgi:hypothetical protein
MNAVRSKYDYKFVYSKVRLRPATQPFIEYKMQGSVSKKA